jgi:catechol 2,3-dioxygenase-like lactoylglutathione lyase family enzyme
MPIALVSLLVRDHDEAIDFFVKMLGFVLVEDAPSTGDEGQPKRWVVVRPPDAETGLLLSEANGEEQAALVGRQFANRVGFIWRVLDFEESYEQLHERGVQFVRGPRTEPYGKVAIFIDISGNKWDLIGPL